MYVEHRRGVVLGRAGEMFEEAVEHGEVVAELLRLLVGDGRRQLLRITDQHLMIGCSLAGAVYRNDEF